MVLRRVQSGLDPYSGTLNHPAPHDSAQAPTVESVSNVLTWRRPEFERKTRWTVFE